MCIRVLRKIGMLDVQAYVTADPCYTTQARARLLKNLC